MPRGGARTSYKTETVRLFRVKCLGPGEPIHFWNSTSKFLRVCPRCQGLQKHFLSLPVIHRVEQHFAFTAE